ncbi:YciI family protein [Kribbella sp. NPDC056951]|uniref:YciI family protein n=1 Tax=Kribbella sp. NPDC056951 TaxID=3345978 RepID=UPI003644C701
MRYVVMIFSSTTPALDAVRAELTASGELVASEGLMPPTDGRIVQIRNGTQVVTAGPLIEKSLAGFLLIDVPDEARAQAVAAQVSTAVGDRVELRGTLISA